MNTYEIYSKSVEGYTNGFGIDDFKKGETAYFWSKHTPKSEPEFISGKVVEIVKAKNAKGEDKIRRVGVEYTGPGFKGQPQQTVRSFGVISQIKGWIFKKDKVEEPAPAPVNKKVDPIEIPEGVESVWIEKAMGPKNKEVKKYLDMGWVFVEKKWDGQKNMYLSLVAKGV